MCGGMEGWREREEVLEHHERGKTVPQRQGGVVHYYIFFRIVANSNCNNVFAIRVHKMDFIFSALCDDTDRCTSKVQNFIDKDCYYECL